MHCAWSSILLWSWNISSYFSTSLLLFGEVILCQTSFTLWRLLCNLANSTGRGTLWSTDLKHERTVINFLLWFSAVPIILISIRSVHSTQHRASETFETASKVSICCLWFWHIMLLMHVHLALLLTGILPDWPDACPGGLINKAYQRH